MTGLPLFSADAILASLHLRAQRGEAADYRRPLAALVANRRAHPWSTCAGTGLLLREPNAPYSGPT